MTMRINRRIFAGGATSLLITAGLAQPAIGQDASPEAAPAGEDEAVSLLTSAATTMTELETFRFSITTVEGDTTVFEAFSLEEVRGAVRRPTDFETTLTVALPFASLDLTAVSIDNEVWIEVPAIGDAVEGGWTSLGSTDGLQSLLNPDVLILESIRYIDDAAIAGEADVEGDPVTLVTGTVNFREIAGQLAGDMQGVEQEIAEGPVGLEIAIDAENRIREIEMAGPLLAMESEDVVRLVTFTEFNEEVEITQPVIEEATP